MNKYICIASGPSLCRKDVQLADFLQAKTIAINNSWQMARHAEIIFSGDFPWWEKYYHHVCSSSGELWSSNEEAALRFNLKHFYAQGPYNSGLRAIQLAIHLGAKIIFLLGYDCSIKNGLHWHGAHQQQLSNPTENSIYGWKKQFAALRKNQEALTIINCTRTTELECFSRMKLIDAVKKYGVDHY
ncbi:hypothetical protein ACMV5L_01780 [Serratia plymuthica]|uniref:hypothetical protein n=1 Tax=Serratia plymuthica TaxID=82996 RepID=UPI003DA40D3E